MSVWCLCGAKLCAINDGSSREMLGLCAHCLATNDATTSPSWKHGAKWDGKPKEKRNLKERV